MVTQRSVVIQPEGGETLASLASVECDLQMTIGLCEYLEKTMSNGRPEFQITDAFTTAILVKYARPFASGVRESIAEAAISKLSPSQRTAHEYYLAYRNKHIAHSVNAFEETCIHARYTEEHVHEKGVHSISCSHARVVGLDVKDVTTILQLSKTLLDFVRRRLSEEEERLLVSVRAIPTEKLLQSAKSNKFLEVDYSKIKQRRKRA